MSNFKSGFVTIIGRTNVGKSSIINKIVGEKVSAVTNKTQTTRKNIKAIVNRKDRNFAQERARDEEAGGYQKTTL